MFSKKILFISLLLCHASVATANDEIICPTVDAIKREPFNHWLPLNENGELISNEELATFKKHVVHFEKAEWIGALDYSANCFYRGTHSIIQKISFAQKAVAPVTNQYWYWSNPGRFAQCRQYIECEGGI